jgi:hypothetical protein
MPCHFNDDILAHFLGTNLLWPIKVPSINSQKIIEWVDGRCSIFAFGQLKILPLFPLIEPILECPLLESFWLSSKKSSLIKMAEIVGTFIEA